jgi:ribonuclease HII
MHLALDQLQIRPGLILVDGHLFSPYPLTLHRCIIKGDATYASIAAASVLAKTYRDDYMINLHAQYPDYRWDANKGYGTLDHRKAIEKLGLTPHHRKSFQVRSQVAEVAKVAEGKKEITQ